MGKIPWSRNGNLLQYSCLENSRTEEEPGGQRSLVGYNLWGHKELDTTKHTHTHTHTHNQLKVPNWISFFISRIFPHKEFQIPGMRICCLSQPLFSLLHSPSELMRVIAASLPITALISLHSSHFLNVFSKISSHRIISTSNKHAIQRKALLPWNHLKITWHDPEFYQCFVTPLRRCLPQDVWPLLLRWVNKLNFIQLQPIHGGIQKKTINSHIRIL